MSPFPTSRTSGRHGRSMAMTHTRLLACVWRCKHCTQHQARASNLAWLWQRQRVVDDRSSLRLFDFYLFDFYLFDFYLFDF
ncbi:MAG: hypothetical protein H3C34_19140 [Caldilineaceae bacterium]|nr:hypothetical protein [Caldilineaceae bacterium]